MRREEGPNKILRENVQRRIVIAADVAGRDLGSVIDEIRAAIARAEGVTDFRQAVHKRLVPILMTAMAAGLALIPLALGGGKTESEIQTPMAIVILCGLTTSTLLNMIVVPTLLSAICETV